jgi:Aerotolerance regulator N-terminal
VGQPQAERAVIAFSAPWFLLAGALAALVPLALHLIRRRPPSRAPLPTQRFLSEDPRTAVRVSRPTDLLLLALRMLLLVLAGAAFARPTWFPAPKGTSEIVLLDRGAAMSGDAWARAVAEARRRLMGPGEVARGELVLFDTAATRIPRRQVTPALFDSLASARPSAGAIRYAAALRAIPPAARELRGADSVRVTLLSRLRWGGWGEGMAPLREAAWPGAIETPDLGPATTSADSASSDSTSSETSNDTTASGDDARRAVVIAPGDRGAFVRAALGATGWAVRTMAGADALPADDARLFVVLAPTSPALAAAIGERARGGATVVVPRSGVTDALADVLPWADFAPEDRPGGELFFSPSLQIDGASDGSAGAPKPGAATLAAWEDGRAAAAAARVGEGCVVFLATDLEGGELPFQASYPRLLDRLAHGCEPQSAAVSADQPLDAGARAVLRGQGPAAVAASAIAPSGGGLAFGRWIMAAALVVALIETFFAYRRRTA